MSPYFTLSLQKCTVALQLALVNIIYIHLSVICCPRLTSCCLVIYFLENMIRGLGSGTMFLRSLTDKSLCCTMSWIRLLLLSQYSYPLDWKTLQRGSAKSQITLSDTSAAPGQLSSHQYLRHRVRRGKYFQSPHWFTQVIQFSSLTRGQSLQALYQYWTLDTFLVFK